EFIRLVGGVGTNLRASISRDGNVIAYVSTRRRGPRVWIKDLARGIDRPLTGGSRPEHWAVLSPDGAKVAFNNSLYPNGEASRGGIPLLVAEVRTGAVQEACLNCFRPEDWSSDGHKLLLGPATAPDFEIQEFEFARKQRKVLIKHPGRNVASPRYSPDGKW